jgi:hypothetical protein
MHNTSGLDPPIKTRKQQLARGSAVPIKVIPQQRKQTQNGRALYDACHTCPTPDSKCKRVIDTAAPAAKRAVKALQRNHRSVGAPVANLLRRAPTTIPLQPAASLASPALRRCGPGEGLLHLLALHLAISAPFCSNVLP